MSPGWRSFVHSRKAGFLTIAIIVTQLGGCTIGLAMGEGPVTDFFICLSPKRDWWFQELLLLLWLVLSFSWLLGALAVVLPGLRPVYWLLVLMIPAAMIGQRWLVENNYHICHFHI